MELGHGLGQTVIVEGVETPGQLAFLRDIGCEEAQGYLFSHPVEAPLFARSWLEHDGTCG